MKKDPPKTTPDSCFVAIFSDSSAVISPKTDVQWLPAQQKIQSKHEWFRIFKFKNVPVKSSCVNCHELKMNMINTSKQKTNNI